MKNRADNNNNTATSIRQGKRWVRGVFFFGGGGGWGGRGWLLPLLIQQLWLTHRKQVRQVRIEKDKKLRMSEWMDVNWLKDECEKERERTKRGKQIANGNQFLSPFSVHMGPYHPITPRTHRPSNTHMEREREHCKYKLRRTTYNRLLSNVSSYKHTN